MAFVETVSTHFWNPFATCKCVTHPDLQAKRRKKSQPSIPERWYLAAFSQFIIFCTVSMIYPWVLSSFPIWLLQEWWWLYHYIFRNIYVFSIIYRIYNHSGNISSYFDLTNRWNETILPQFKEASRTRFEKISLSELANIYDAVTEVCDLVSSLWLPWYSFCTCIMVPSICFIGYKAVFPFDAMSIFYTGLFCAVLLVMSLISSLLDSAVCLCLIWWSSALSIELLYYGCTCC